MDKFENIEKRLGDYEFLILDFDGTLVDLNVNWNNLKKKLNQFCLKEKNIEINFNPLNKGLEKAKETFDNNFYLKLLKIITGFEMNESKYRLNSGLITFINNSEKKIIIYSMNTKETINSFVKKHFKKRPIFIISRETIYEPKPTNKDLLRIIQKFNSVSKKFAFIGNSKEDRESGDLARIKTYIIKI